MCNHPNAAFEFLAKNGRIESSEVTALIPQVYVNQMKVHVWASTGQSLICCQGCYLTFYIHSSCGKHVE